MAFSCMYDEISRSILSPQSIHLVYLEEPQAVVLKQGFESRALRIKLAKTITYDEFVMHTVRY